MSQRLVVTPGLILISLFLFPCLCNADDPVENFVMCADSIARTQDDDAFAKFVVDNSILVGAAVGWVLDIAIEYGDEGDVEVEKENFEFAEHVARVHAEKSGSEVPLQLVEKYKGWTPEQRARRIHARELDTLATNARDEDKFEQAVDLFNQAKAIYETIGDARSVAVVWGSLGVAYWYAGDYEKAGESYQQALVARRAIEDRILEGKTLNGLGSVNHRLGRYAAAANYYQQAITLRRQTKDIAGLLTSLTYLGNTYFAVRKLTAARHAYEEAIALEAATGNPTQQGELYISLGNFYYEEGRLTASSEMYRHAIELAEIEGDTLQETISRNNLALNLAWNYRCREALRELDTVEGLLRTYADDEQSLNLMRNRGITYLNMEELDLAFEQLQLYLQRCESEDFLDRKPEALINLGYYYQEAGDFEKALSLAEEGATLARELEDYDKVRDANVLAAMLERALGRYEESLARWNSIIEHDRAENSLSENMVERAEIANIYALQRRTVEARDIYTKLEGPVLESGRSELIAAVDLGLGHTFEKENVDSARFYYERALQRTQQARARIGASEVRTGFFSGAIRRFNYEEVARYYASVAQETGEDRWMAYAFDTVERTKSRGLADLLSQHICADYSAQEETLLDSLYQIDKSTAEGRRDYAYIERQYIELRRQRVDGAVGSLATASALAGLRDVQQVLPRNTILLEYAVGDTVSLLWAVDHDGADLYELPGRARLKRQVELLRSSLTAAMDHDVFLLKTARALYNEIVAVAENRIQKAEKTVIVPDGVLFELPFEILLTEDPPDDAEWREIPFLFRSRSLVYSPSATVFVRLETSPGSENYKQSLLALGDPDYTLFGDADLGPGYGSQPLPNARAEVESINSIMGGNNTILLGKAANEAALRKQLRESTPRIIHMATHAYVDAFEPVYSSVVLCPSGSSGDDGYLHTLEILSLPMDVELVVLSACETARGRVGRGEGVVGLSRAFIASGAETLVASLWPVPDESTPILMTKFYESMIREGKPPSEALNNARLAMLENSSFSHPYFWAPFVLIGGERSP